MIKNPLTNAGDPRDGGSMPGLGRFPGVGRNTKPTSGPTAETKS